MPVFRDDFTTYEQGIIPAPYALGLDGISTVIDGAEYGVTKNVLRLGRGNTTGRSYIHYILEEHSVAGMRTAGRVWTGVSTFVGRRIAVTIFDGTPDGTPDGLEAALIYPGTFALTRRSGTHTVEVLTSTPVAWALSTWYGLEVAWSAGLLRGTLKDADGVTLAVLQDVVATPPETVKAGLSLYANNNSSAQVVWDWAEFDVNYAGPGPTRIRSHVSEDAGSLFQATQAIAVENAVTEAFPFGSTFMPAMPRPFLEALVPAQAAAVYYPIPTRNQEMLVTVEGETTLGRMANVYPSSILARVDDLTEFDGSTATAQEAIQYIFDQWASEFSWFAAEAVPDLRILVDGGVGAERQYYIDNPEAGVLTIEAIAIPQDGNERRSMREIVDEWLAIFPGTIIRQNSTGNIELVPRVGPDAPETALDLTWRDIISMSDGEDDPRSVRNRARVVSQGYEFVAEQAVAEPAYSVLRAVGGLTVAALEDGEVIPDNRVDMGGLFQLLPFTGLASRDDVEVSYTFTAYSSRNPNIDADLVSEGTTSGTLTLAPNGTGTITLNHTVLGIHNLTVRVYFGRATSGDGLMITAVTGMPAKVDGIAFDRYLAYILEVDAVGSAWQRAAGEIIGFFGYSSETLPAEGGGNALDNSVALYGEREAIIRSTVFQLTPEQALQVARGYVLANINPRTIREVQQSEWDKYPVKFDHVGRFVDLPNGERAVVENRSYSDAFQPGGGMMQSAFTATVTEIVLDTTTAFLLMDDGSYFVLDDGTIAESA